MSTARFGNAARCVSALLGSEAASTSAASRSASTRIPPMNGSTIARGFQRDRDPHAVVRRAERSRHRIGMRHYRDGGQRGRPPRNHRDQRLDLAGLHRGVAAGRAPDADAAEHGDPRAEPGEPRCNRAADASGLGRSCWVRCRRHEADGVHRASGREGGGRRGPRNDGGRPHRQPGEHQRDQDHEARGQRGRRARQDHSVAERR